MMEKQNAVERKKAAGDAAEIDDVIDAGAEHFAKAGAGRGLGVATANLGLRRHNRRPVTENMC